MPDNRKKQPPSRSPDDPDDMVDRVMGRLVQMEQQKSLGRRIMRGCVWGLILLLVAAGVLIGLQLAGMIDLGQWRIFGGDGD